MLSSCNLLAHSKGSGMQRLALAVSSLLLAVPLASASPLLARPSCPAGYYRNASLLFGCGEQLSGSHALLVGATDAAPASRWIATVPAGVDQLELRAAAPAGLGITLSIRELGSGEEILRGETSERSSSAVWKGTRLIMLGGASKNGDRQHVILKCSDSTPAAFSAEVTIGKWGARAFANISFTCANYEECSAVPWGCSTYYPYEARSLVFNWSSWAQQVYPDASSAWKDLCIPVAKGLPSGPGSIPYYAWEEVWQKWPGARDWQAAFKFMDGLAGESEDNRVDQEEFQAAFSLAGIYLAMYIWCEQLQHSFWTSSAAWATYSSELQDDTVAGIPFAHWESKIWKLYKPTGGFQKPAAQAAFVYVDVDGDGLITKEELTGTFESCSSTSPLFEEPAAGLDFMGMSTTAAGADLPGKPSADELQGTWQYAGGTFRLLRSGEERLEVEADFGEDLHVAGGLRPEGQWMQGQLETAEGEAFGLLRVRYDRERKTAVSQFRSPHAEEWGQEVVATRVLEASTTSMWASALPVADTGCCQDEHVECFACKAHRSAQEVCERMLPPLLAGCPEKKLDDAVENESEALCLYDGVAFTAEKLFWSGASNASNTSSVSRCQEMCADTPGCTRFSYAADGSCGLLGSAAEWQHSPGVVSGPPRCVARMQTAVGRMDWAKLGDAQRLSLSESLAYAIASLTELPLQAMVDDEGQPGRVTLATEGMMEVFLELPYGWTLHQLSTRISNELLKGPVAKCLSNASVALRDVDLHGLLVRTMLSAEPQAQCTLLHTKYAPATSSPPAFVADNVSACQASCGSQPRCRHFTFWQEGGLCTLHEAEASALLDGSAVAGPAVCPPPPRTQEPYKADVLQAPPDWTKIWATVWATFRVTTLFIVIFGCGMGLRRTLLPRTIMRLLHIQKTRQSRDDSEPPHLYRPLSTSDDGAALAVRSREVCVAGAVTHGLPAEGQAAWVPQFLGPSQCKSLAAGVPPPSGALPAAWPQLAAVPGLNPGYFSAAALPTGVPWALPRPALRLPPPTPSSPRVEQGDVMARIDVNGRPYT